MRARTVFVMLVLLATEAQAFAQAEPFYPMMPARSLGTAAGGRSYAAGGNALFLNPASLAVTNQYVLGGGYTLARTGGIEDSYAHGLNVEWTDSTPNALKLGMGLAYSYLMTDDKKTSNIHGAMTYSLPFEVVGVHLGVGMHWLQDFVAEMGVEDDLWSFDAGISFNLQNQLTLGVVGHNIMNTPDNGLPQGVGTGLSYWVGPVVVSADVVARFDLDDGSGTQQETLMSYIGGFQYMLTQGVFARGAFRYDDGRKTAAGDDAVKSLGAGLTYIAGNRVGVELGYRQGLDDSDDLMVGLNLELYNPFALAR